MIKELKYITFAFTVILFVFFSGKYYFSDANIKKSNITINNFSLFLKKYSDTIPLVSKNDEKYIFYSDPEKKTKKEYSFWNLLNNE